MKPDMAIQQAAAYGPTLTIVRDALQEAAQESSELRTLLLKSAVLREFDVGLLSRLAGRQEEDAELLHEVAFFIPLEEADEGTFYYDEFARQALLDVASEKDEQILLQACREAADYFRERAQQTRDAALSRKYEQQMLYYQLLADPQQGFTAWQQAWAAVSREHVDYDRQAELIHVVDDAWDSLADVPGAQVGVLLKKGWLAFDLGSWQSAIDGFWQLLARDPHADPARLYLNSRFPFPLADGKLHPVIESEANVGLGYTYFRQGTLGLAAQHFQKAVRLIGQKPAGQGRDRRERDRLIRAKALCGLGEVCTRMGAPEGILLRRRLLPEKEQRRTLVEYAQASETPPLEDLALDRLLREAEEFFEDALEAIADHESAAGYRLRIQAQQAFLYLEQGDWQGAQALFEDVRRQELARFGVDGERAAKGRRIAERLARINLYLGDCRLLAAETPTLTEEELPPEPADFLRRQQVRLRGDFLERVAKRRETKLDLARARVSGETAESAALKYYGTAWSLWKAINKREGMALSLRRQADVAALHPEDPGQRKQALHLYRTSLELYEQIGNPSEIAHAQERLDFLNARAGLPEGDRPLAENEMALAKSPMAEERPMKVKRPTRKGSSLKEFQEAVESVLAHRRRFFRYRVARKLERRLRRMYRLTATLGGLVITGVLCGWLVWLVAPWLGQISARVTGLSWALPALSVSFIVVFMILIADQLTFIRRWTVGMIPRRWFWLDQDQVAIDDIGLHLYDHTGQRKRLIRWQDVWRVRSQTWNEVEDEEKEGGRAAVFGVESQVVRFGRRLRGYRRLLQGIKSHLGIPDQVIRFDHQLRGYRRLLRTSKDYVAATGDAGRWQEPETAYLEGSFFLWTYIMLLLAIFLAFPLTLIFALIPAITRFGPTVFAIAAAFVAFAGLVIAVFRYDEWRFMHPRRKRPKSTDGEETV